MLLKVHPKPHKEGSDSTLQNMLVVKFNEMVLFRQELRRSSSAHSNLESDRVADGYDELLICYDPPLEPPADFPGAMEAKELVVPLKPDVRGMKEVEVSLHNSDTTGYDMGEQYSGWFTECFGYKVMLVYLGPSLRPVLGNLSPSVANARDGGLAPAQSSGGAKSWLGSVVGSVPALGSWLGGVDAKGEDDERAKITFADCGAYLVVTTESLADVSSRLPEGEEMDVTKFRPNIVLSGASEAWEEDFWDSVEFCDHEVEGISEPGKREGDIPRLLLTANCTRCASINVDYETGRQGRGAAGEVLKKLMKDRRVDAGRKWSPVFGRYGFLDRWTAQGDWPVVSVGDEVMVGGRRQERRTWGTFNPSRSFIAML
ncbi:MAG: hypothetical protein LQ340_006987 [Diploschistes diacapsis]|nr:MAG: hypothetical protein LQ340_006987 [Diploschistes diacapsis]